MDARWPDLRSAVTFTLLRCSNAPSVLRRADILKMDVEEYHSEAVAGESALATGLGITSYGQHWRANVSGPNNTRDDRARRRSRDIPCSMPTPMLYVPQITAV